MSKKALSLILLDTRSAHNVGSIFRTADGAGVEKIYLVGYTSTPIDKFNRPSRQIAKTALGAEKCVPWEYAPDINKLITKLKKSGLAVWALEQSPDSIDYKKAKLTGPTALVLGNEVEGIKKSLLKKCDQIIEIPMKGSLSRQDSHPSQTGQGKESLNVAVATGIALYKLTGSI